MRLALIGCGLIGASFAAALKKAQAIDCIVAFNRHRERAQEAVQKGYADEVAETISEAVKDADAIVVAVPVCAMRSVFAEIASHASDTAYICDVGSVRGVVIEAARETLGEKFNHYVPVHPIAGSDKSGIDAARADLFQEAVAISTPEATTLKDAVEFWETLWQNVGCRVIRMSATEHDSIFGSVSHLPHIVAFALMQTVLQTKNAKERLAIAGPGFRDTTRIAGASPRMWRDICLTNKKAVLENLVAYEKALATLHALIEKEDGDALEKAFELSSAARKTLFQESK